MAGAAGAARAARRRVRAASASLRTLPDYLIIGAQKAGTTSLYDDLKQHPAVLPALQKEVHYFDLNYDHGELWYRTMFPLEARRRLERRRRQHRVITGEASPYYLYHPLVPARVAQLLPEVRIIAILRDPVERAWSHYRHEVAAGREDLSFTDALDAEPERLASVAAGIAAGATDDSVRLHRTASYYARGLYAEQLTRWLAHFPREALHVLRAEDLFHRPGPTWSALTAFLEIDRRPRLDFVVHNRRHDPGFDRAARERLARMYVEPNRELVDLLGPEFSWPAP